MPKKKKWPISGALTGDPVDTRKNEELAKSSADTGEPNAASAKKMKRTKAKAARRKCNVEEFERCVTDTFKMEIENIIRTLQNSCRTAPHIFPASLSKNERAYIHAICVQHGLKSKSSGKRNKRFIKISLKTTFKIQSYNLNYEEEISDMMNQAEDLYKEERSENCRPPGKKSFISPSCVLTSKCKMSVPKAHRNNLSRIRECLPVFQKKSEILRLLTASQVVIISSETGSGKTTQIPQFILEEAYDKNKYCKIICTQPRRISTISVAERVAAERGEDVGNIVGYQIKHGTNAGSNSALIYCTNGVIFRVFMKHDRDFFKHITHLILDEIHERDKYTDILLILIKNILQENPHVKIILMSATCDIQLFMSYFNNVQLLHIEGQHYEVQEYFLEDVLDFLGLSTEPPKSTADIDIVSDNDCDVIANSDYDKEEMNSVINRCIEFRDENDGLQLLQLIMSENADINHQTPDNGYTPLMAAVISGNVKLAEILLNMGADVTLKSNILDRTVSSWVSELHNEEISNRICCNEMPQCIEDPGEALQPYKLQNKFMSIDFNLIVKLIGFIHQKDEHGTILVFLPGYEDINVCTQKLVQSSLDEYKFKIICLHSSMPSNVRKSVFQQFPSKQKIILSTNIAETGVTIPDVVYVIDSGLAKECSYDSINDISSLQKMYISKASADQRRGRAGRTCNGACFRLYSRSCYDLLVPNSIPEILRVPLYEICLQIKQLEFKGTILDFFKLGLQCPSELSIESAVTGLILMGALDADEQITVLGTQLLHLSLDPRLGKMLLYAAYLRCLDPVLTIVSCLSERDLFCLPSDPNERKLAAIKQKDLAGDSLSEHFGLIRAFQLWQTSQIKGTNVCDEFFISNMAMESVNATHVQLISQLQSIGITDGCGVDGRNNLNTNSNKCAVVKAAIAVGSFPNMAFMVKKKDIITRTTKKVRFCLGSAVNSISNCEYGIAYHELSKIGGGHIIRCGTIVSLLTVALMCGEVFESESDHHLTVDGWIKIAHKYKNLNKLRMLTNRLINKKILQPSYIYTKSENQFFQHLVNILVSEDASYNFQNNSEIGLPPKFIARNRHPTSNRNYGAPQEGLYRTPYNTLNRDTIRPQDRYRQKKQEKNSFPQEQQVGLYRLCTSNAKRTASHLKQSISVNPRTLGVTKREEVKSKPSEFALKYFINVNSQPPSDKKTEDIKGNKSSEFNCASLPCRKWYGFFNQMTLLNKKKSNPNYQEIFKGLPCSVDNISAATKLIAAINLHSESDSEKLLRSIERVNNQPNPIFNTLNSAFFVIKPIDQEEFNSSLLNSNWTFCPEIEKKLYKFYKLDFAIYLFFTVCNTKEFQGIAKLMEVYDGTKSVCPIKWLSVRNVTFKSIEARSLLNLANSQLPVYQSRDGQEVDIFTAQKLAEMFFYS